MVKIAKGWFVKMKKERTSIHLIYMPLGLLLIIPFIQACQTGKGQSNIDGLADSSYLRAKAYYDSIDFHKKAVLSSPEIKRIQKGLEHFYTHVLGSRFNGSMLVAHKGITIFEKHQGYADCQQKTPITNNTTFQLASTSKPFTAMGILYLKKQDKLLLTDSVQKFFPDFPYSG